MEIALLITALAFGLAAKASGVSTAISQTLESQLFLQMGGQVGAAC